MATTLETKNVYRGETKTFRLTFTNASDGTRLNLDTDVTAIELEIGDSVNVAPSLAISLAGGGIVKLTQSGDTLGQADATFSAAQTDTLTTDPKVKWADVVVILTGGARKVAKLFRVNVIETVNDL